MHCALRSSIAILQELGNRRRNRSHTPDQEVRRDDAASATMREGGRSTAEIAPYAAATLISAITERCRTKGGYWG
jgi:hypothetical protein